MARLAWTNDYPISSEDIIYALQEVDVELILAAAAKKTGEEKASLLMKLRELLAELEK